LNAGDEHRARAPEDPIGLYRRAFAEYGARALWNKRRLETPTAADRRAYQAHAGGRQT
jgi:hypothetical protein